MYSESKRNVTEAECVKVNNVSVVLSKTTVNLITIDFSSLIHRSNIKGHRLSAAK